MKGMLWYDCDPKTDLKVKVEQAAAYYSKKYGQAPNLALVHPSMAPTSNGKPGAVEIRPARCILPNHILIGVDEQRDRP